MIQTNFILSENETVCKTKHEMIVKHMLYIKYSVVTMYTILCKV